MKMKKIFCAVTVLAVLIGSCTSGVVSAVRPAVGNGGTKGSPARVTERQSPPAVQNETPRPNQTEPAAESNYTIRQNPDNTITITGFTPSRRDGDARNYFFYTTDTNVIIPETLYNLRVKEIISFKREPIITREDPEEILGINEQAAPVRRIPPLWKLTSVVIPDTVLTIGERAFREEQLRQVTLGNGVQIIGAQAFQGNAGLTEIIIPNSVTYIGQNAFNNCGLTSVSLRSSLRTIGRNAFAGNRITSVTIPNSVTVIEPETFRDNRITSVTLPAGLTSIGEGAFQFNGLTSITIPDSVTRIGDNAFANNRLTSVTLGNNSGANISSNAFAGDNNNITSWTLPADIPVILVPGGGYGGSFISNDLANFYVSQNRAAGTYIKNGPIWTRSTAGGID